MSAKVLLSSCGSAGSASVQTMLFRRAMSNVGIAEQNLITALYVTQDGDCHKSGFDATSCLPNDFKDSICSFLKEKQIKLKPGTSRTFYWPSQSAPYKSFSLAAVPAEIGPDSHIDLRKSKTRSAFSSCVRSLRAMKETQLLVDDVADMTSASEGCHLAAYNFDVFKSEPKYKEEAMDLSLFHDASAESKELWSRGLIQADCQNFARGLTEMPSNHMSPEAFVQEVVNMFEEHRGESEMKLEIKIRNEDWLREQRMNGFLAVAQGSSQKPYLLEIHLTHPRVSSAEGEGESESGCVNQQPLVLVGKGVCFDSGGISIKPASSMGLMRGDMGGAACVAATALGVMRLNLEGNLVCLMGLCENMPSSTAYKPGDVIISRSGKSIEIDNTDAEGRVVLADVLDYSDSFNPSAVIDMATLTGAMAVSLGAAFTGTFSTTNKLYDTLKKSGHLTGDQVWRMPLSSYYVSQVTNSTLADVINTTKGPATGGGACTAAAFLSQFVKCPHWMHLDIAGVMNNPAASDDTFLGAVGKGMSGRPTRTMIEFCRNYFNGS